MCCSRHRRDAKGILSVRAEDVLKGESGAERQYIDKWHTECDQNDILCDDGTLCICYVWAINFSIAQKRDSLSALLYPALCPRGLTYVDLKVFRQWGT